MEDKTRFVPFHTQKRMHKLADMTPLDTPLFVVINLNTFCNFKCQYCIHGNSALYAKYKYRNSRMERPLLEKAIDDMRGFPRQVEHFGFIGAGEPLMHPELPEFVRHVKDSGIAKYVSVTSNCSLLTAEKSRALLDAGLDELRMTLVHTTSSGYKRLTGIFSDVELVKANMRKMRELRDEGGYKTRLVCKLIDTWLTEPEKEKYSEWHDCADALATNTVCDLLGGESDTVDYSKKDKALDGLSPLKRDRVVCPYPFYYLCIETDGDASTCCADIEAELVIGNILKQHVVDIWNGDTANQQRAVQALGKKKELYQACRKCKFLESVSQDSDLDAIQDKLVSIYSRYWKIP